ncbi:hypothetical protein QFC19_000577 [Naganishia cerealis]|uniref:Uncharacterized protein n=1 Tax=Naganishia cerealis TaxID=610337 RepID=A0ACC2WN14_9TREE|nr:hypothetical protein QFC19_000577 [Naganishia cerealis]
MIVFYALGTAATKVLCNSTPSLISALLYKFLLTSEASARLRKACVQTLSNQKWGFNDGKIAKALVFVTLGHFATCLGDTLASELGILSSAQPILVTTLKPCPPGTNGGISLFGTGMSIVGGSIIGATVSILQARFGVVHNIGTASFITVGALAGFTGSMLDSLLGATLQQTLYDADEKKILLDGAAEEQRKLVGVAANNQVVSGLEVLTNNQVNFISSATIALLSGFCGVYIL